MAISVEPLVSTVRWYDGAFVPHVTPYTAIASLIWETPTTVYIAGLHGTMTREMWQELRDALRDAGVRVVHAERHGRERTWQVEPHITSGGTG